MDFELSERATEFSARVDHFIRNEVIPLESSATENGLPDDLLRAARDTARSSGLWAPQLPVEYGGQGLDFLDVCSVFEAAGQSLLGPLVLGCAAPDEGNAHLLLLAGSERQKKEYLRPLAAGELASRGVKTVQAGALAERALALMEEHSITSLFIVDAAGQPCGILHLHDLLRAGVV